VITVGVTGGIGSGKSLICRIFTAMDIPVYEADRRAETILNDDRDVQHALSGLLGEKIFRDGKPDKRLMADIIFRDKEVLKKVNRIIHPAVLNDFILWKRQYTFLPYVIHEAAILFESGADKIMDFVITVYAPVDMRIRRIMERDGVTASDVRIRMKNQWSEKKRQENADIVVYNDEKHLVIPQVLSIHKALVKRAGNKITENKKWQD